MESFYVTLPSLGTGNTIGTYVQKLPEVTKLPGSWEVALAELIYPASWINVTEANRRGYLCYDESYYHENEVESIRPWSCNQNNPDFFDLPIGHYTRVRLGESLNYEIANFATADPERKNKKYFGMKHGVMKFRGTDQGVKLKIHPDLAEIMGFENSEFCARLVDATLMPFSLPHSLYVYTNIIEPQIVGPTKAQLLAVVPAGERTQLAVRYATTPLQYVALRYDQLESIEVNIRDSSGDIIPFASGHCVVKLHIRPMQDTP